MDIELSHRIDAIQELPGHQDRAWNVAWNPTKALISSCSADKTVRMYSYTDASNSSTPTFSHIATIPTGHTKTVRSIAWAPSGKTLATASFDANIGIWEQEESDENNGEWECASLLEGHETECKSVAYSSSGTLLASCSRDKTVWIWEVHPDADFECLGVLMEHTQDVKCVAWHPEEEILASASYDDTIKMYIDDPSDDWFCFLTLTGHSSTVWSLAWAPKGSYLASASDDKTVRIWRRIAEHKWECTLVIEGNERSVYSVTWGVGKSSSPSLGWLAAVGSDGVVRIWDISENEDSTLQQKLIARLPEAHGVHDINSVAWCPRRGMEDLLATTGDDGATRIWRVQPVS
ncbi:putative cytosolic iron-sulfur protein assembly protein 1 [Favolaschia claudopus]|uniref:Probable cytosolic iron-sulfur protein assembly protein 1 n=1 Tax=Favolaschia claudopus TaxID=2862362 RepID=A0AAW0E771_9AGAR